MNAIPKRGIMKVPTLAESLTTISSSSSRHSHGTIRRAPKSGRQGQNNKSTNNLLRRLSTLSSVTTRDKIAQTKDDDNNNKRRVQFDKITIREYEIQPSDNPSPLFPPGLELGWNYNILHSSYSIDTYEHERQGERQARYQERPLKLHYRRMLLEEFGFSREEIEVASQRARDIREERERSIERMRLDWFDRVGEDLSDCWSRFWMFWSCKRSSEEVVVVLGSDDRLHPSVLVDRSVEANSFFHASLTDDQRLKVIDDNDGDTASKEEEESKDG